MKWNWNWISFIPFIFILRQCDLKKISSCVLRQTEIEFKHIIGNCYIKMTNNIEEFCTLGNWNQKISMDEIDSEQQLMLQDPYDSIWLKIVAILSYFIGLTNSALMLAFINYENEHHGNFRTVIIQLLSNLYAMVKFMYSEKATKF